MINKLQYYYGIAVRACTGKTVPEMTRKIGAALFHFQFNTEEQRHMFCPQTSIRVAIPFSQTNSRVFLRW